MFDIGSIWVPRPKDVVGGLYAQRWVYQPQTIVTAAITLSTSLNDALSLCPVDKVRFITGMSAGATGGAGQTTVSVQALIFNPATVASFASIFFPRDQIGATVPAVGTLNPDFIMFPGEQIQAQATFSAGGAANTFTFCAWGFDIPRGNVQ